MVSLSKIQFVKSFFLLLPIRQKFFFASAKHLDIITMDKHTNGRGRSAFEFNGHDDV